MTGAQPPFRHPERIEGSLYKLSDLRNQPSGARFLAPILEAAAHEFLTADT